MSEIVVSSPSQILNFAFDACLYKIGRYDSVAKVRDEMLGCSLETFLKCRLCSFSIAYYQQSGNVPIRIINLNQPILAICLGNEVCTHVHSHIIYIRIHVHNTHEQFI